MQSNIYPHAGGGAVEVEQRLVSMLALWKVPVTVHSALEVQRKLCGIQQRGGYGPRPADFSWPVACSGSCKASP